jgi:hypothetical protein
VRVPLTVPAQAANFQPTTVIITAVYAGVTLERQIRVVRPEALVLPALQIEVKIGDLCQQSYVEGGSVTLVIKNLTVFSNLMGMQFTWSVEGAAINANNTKDLVIPSLPAAGTNVTVDVVVTNVDGLRATGHLVFTTTKQLSAIGELQHSLPCTIKGILQLNANIPPWVPIEAGPLPEQQLALIEQQTELLMRQASKVEPLIKELRHMQRHGKSSTH